MGSMLKNKIKKFKMLYLIFAFDTESAVAHNYAPGEIITRFERGVVNIQPGSTKGDISTIVDSTICSFLSRYNLHEIQRAIPDFIPSETLTTLENGEVIKVSERPKIFGAVGISKDRLSFSLVS